MLLAVPANEVTLDAWPCKAHLVEDLFRAVCQAAGRVPSEGGGNLIILSGRDGVINSS